MEDKITGLISAALGTLGCTQNIDKISLTYPPQSANADFACNIAFLASRELKIAPLEAAKKICGMIAESKNSSGLVASVAAPGFINFTVDPKLFIEVIDQNTQVPQINKDKQIAVEFTDPNPFKVFHIGHLFSNTVGESIARIYEATGARVTRMCYQGDVGRHVACSVWGMIKLLEVTPDLDAAVAISKLESQVSQPTADVVAWLGRAYAHGATAYKDNEIAKNQITTINAQIFVAAQKMWVDLDPDFTPIVEYSKFVKDAEYSQEVISHFYTVGRKVSLEAFELIYARLGTKFDRYYFESAVAEDGYKTVLDNLKSGVFEKSEGAIVFMGEKYGLHTRVLINKHGLPTYEAKELGLNPKKFADLPYLDESLIITANEIDEYFKVLLCALNLVAPDIAAKTKHLSHGFLRLTTGKMASRTGQVVAGEWLVDQVTDKLVQKITESQKIEPSQIKNVAEKVGVGAIKYSILRSNMRDDMVFDLESSITYDGNSGPYIMYTSVRLRSLIAKSTVPTTDAPLVASLLNEHEIDLIKQISRFAQTARLAATNCAPHAICTLLYEICQKFNNYYNFVTILDAEPNTVAQRLKIIAYTSRVLESGLQMLGIELIERM